MSWRMTLPTPLSQVMFPHYPLPDRSYLSAGPPLQIYDPDLSLDAETVLRANYHVVFALIRGGPQRPRLPLELVIQICSFGCFSQPNPSKAFSVQRDAHSFSAPIGCIWPPPRPIVLLKTPPLATPDGGSLGVARFEILVNSVDGDDYRTKQYWTKFFIKTSLPTRYELVFDDPDNSGCKFMQPSKPLRGISRLSTTMAEPSSRVRHATIDSSHELWQKIEPGDSLELRMDPFRPWARDDMCDVVIRVYEVWEPSSAMLGLAEGDGLLKPPCKKAKRKLRRILSVGYLDEKYEHCVPGNWAVIVYIFWDVGQNNILKLLKRLGRACGSSSLSQQTVVVIFVGAQKLACQTYDTTIRRTVYHKLYYLLKTGVFISGTAQQQLNDSADVPRRTVQKSKPKAESQPQTCNSVSGLDAGTLLRGYYDAVFAFIRACVLLANLGKAFSAQTPPLAALNNERHAITRFEAMVKRLRGNLYRYRTITSSSFYHAYSQLQRMEYRFPVFIEESDSGSDVSETDESLDTEPILWHYYRVVFALIRGGLGRRCLPFERRRMEPLKLQSFLKTPPLNFQNGRRPVIEHAEIVVKCVCDMSDFDVEEKFWPCFDLTLPAENHGAFEVVVTPPGHERRMIIGQDHEVWRYVRLGDGLELAIMCCDNVPDNGCDAVIHVFERWEPSFAMIWLA
ncbi:hypothetical protein BDV93DRAFT_584703 [Ceratobasidium sp. AG-I]|nr:hypothetical protein BDV93DRAFT_584703 [Ceratobasidium sp. AG-I]